MKVKVGNTIYDSNEQPIMVILTDADKRNITNMSPEATKYCEFPDSMDIVTVRAWMKDMPIPEEKS